MTRANRATLAALGAAIEGGRPELARRELGRFDPLIALRGRRLLSAALDRAHLGTNVHDPVHLARIAFLNLAKGSPESDFDDVPAVAAEQQAFAATLRAPRRGPWLTVSLSILLVTSTAAAVVAWRLTRPFDPRTSPDGRALSEHLTGFVIANSREDSALRDRARAQATSAAVRKSLGAAPTDRLGELMDAATALDATRESGDRMTLAAAALNRALFEAKRPYFVDTDVLPGPVKPQAALLGFYVERESLIRSGSETHRVLHLWRLDHLNLVQGYIGYTRPSMPAATVLLDQVEADLVRYVLPALAEGQPMSLVDEAIELEAESRGQSWVLAVNTRGGELLRGYFAATELGRDPAVRRVGELLARRRALVESWRKDLAGLGHVLRIPQRLVPEADYSKDLSLRVPRAQLGEWDTLHAELLEPAPSAAFRRLRDFYVASVERHEVQHRIDFARGLFPIPELLCKQLGVDDPLDTPEGSLRARAREELSAYLASVIASTHSPVLELVLLSRHVFVSRGGTYWHAALAVFRGIGFELGLDVDAVIGRGVIRAERFAKLWASVLERPPAELRAAAERFHQKAHGGPLAAVEVVAHTDHREWRH